jgi:hypothetical protein
MRLPTSVEDGGGTINYVFHPPESGPAVRDYLVEGEEIWSTEFPTLEDYFAAVEESEGFRTARGREVMTVTFYQQELEERDLASDGVDE